MSNQSARKWWKSGDVYFCCESGFNCAVIESVWVGGNTWEWQIFDGKMLVKECDSPVVTSLKCAKATAIYHARRLAKSYAKKGKWRDAQEES